MGSRSLARWGGMAAILGGFGWVLKGGTILVGGPDWLEFGLGSALLFPAGLVGLHAQLDGRGGLMERIGYWLAGIAVIPLLAMVGGVVLSGGLPASPPPAVRLALLIASLSILLGLVLLGVVSLRARVMPAPWRVVPLATALTVPVLNVLLVTLVFPLTGVSSEWSERLIEIPLILFGLGWMLFGYALWSGKAAQPVASAAKA